MRSRPGFPEATDDAIADMSAPPAYTACPSPYLREFVEEGKSDRGTRDDPGPFAADTTAGKTSLKCFATDSVEKFRVLGERFMGHKLENIRHVDIEP